MHSRRPNAPRVLGIATVATIVAGCGSGGSSTVSAAAYVKSICSAVAPFQRDIQARSAALGTTHLASAQQGKQELQSFLGSASADADRAASRVKGAGTPNVSDGKQVASTLEGAFTQLQRAMHSATAQADALPTSSPEAFRSGASALGNSVQTSIGAIGSSLAGLRNADLEKAAANEPSCKSLST